jgi:hypothetical protein
VADDTAAGRSNFSVISGDRRMLLEEKDGCFAIIIPTELTYQGFLMLIDRLYGLENVVSGVAQTNGPVHSDDVPEMLRSHLATGTSGPRYVRIDIIGPFVCTWEESGQDTGSDRGEFGFGFPEFNEFALRNILFFAGTGIGADIERLLLDIEAFCLQPAN